jgi:hypothetical protein
MKEFHITCLAPVPPWAGEHRRQVEVTVRANSIEEAKTLAKASVRTDMLRWATDAGRQVSVVGKEQQFPTL